MNSRTAPEVTEGCGNVFVDLGLKSAADLQVKAELTRQLHNRLATLGLTQSEAAKRLGLRQPDVSRIMNGRFTGFSMERLIALLNGVGVDVDIVLRAPRQSSGRARRPARVRVKSSAREDNLQAER